MNALSVNQLQLFNTFKKILNKNDLNYLIVIRYNMRTAKELTSGCSEVN